MAMNEVLGKLQIDGIGAEFDPQKHALILNGTERRAICVQMAITTRGRDVTFRDNSADEAADEVLRVAKQFYAYITNGE
jgi:hypothetical protein